MRKGTCKHFTGDFHNTHCAVDVCYKAVTPDPDGWGSGLRLPCNAVLHWPNASPTQIAEFEKRGKCDKYQEPTDKEIADHEAVMKAHMDKITLTFPLIGAVKKEHKGKDWRGVKECPACGGKLHMTHAAYNGHVWGACETEGCVRWAE